MRRTRRSGTCAREGEIDDESIELVNTVCGHEKFATKVKFLFVAKSS